MADQLTRQAIAWVAQQAIAYKNPWSENMAGALALSWSLARADDFDERLPQLAGQYRLPLTTFVAPSLLEEAPDLVRRLAAMGTVALWAGEAGGPMDPPSQEVLIRWREQIERATGGQPVGVRLSPRTASDAWLEALVRSGYAFLSSPEYRHLLPQVIRTHRAMPIFARERELWLIPELTPADLEDAKRGSAQGEDSFERAMEAVAMDEGLLHLSLAPGQVDSMMLNRLDALFSHAKRSHIWATDVASILEFYRVWGHLRVSTDYPTPNRTAIQISNTGARHSGDLSVFIRMSQRMESPDIRPTTLGSPPVHPFTQDGLTWRFDLARIPPGKNYLYHLYRTESP